MPEKSKRTRKNSTAKTNQTYTQVRIDDDTRLSDLLNANIGDILKHFTVDANGYICQINGGE